MIIGDGYNKPFESVIRETNEGILFDLDNIDKTPEELDSDLDESLVHGVKLYIAKVNPMIPNLGDEKDKLFIKKFYDLLMNVFGSEAIMKPQNYILKPSEIDALRNEYGNDFDEVVNLGEKTINNVLKYGVKDIYEWRLVNWGTAFNADNTYYRLPFFKRKEFAN